jgi:ribosome biogenesis protein ENP2
MTIASQCIKMTGDGEHIIVTGTYPPIVRCYTVTDLALKFQRGLTSDVVAFETLSDDFGKLVFLQSDRTINFHAPYGTHYSVRVPKFGRDLVYNWSSCDVLVSGTGNEIYRLNLEHGQFREPFSLSFEGCNKMHINLGNKDSNRSQIKTVRNDKEGAVREISFMPKVMVINEETRVVRRV